MKKSTTRQHTRRWLSYTTGLIYGILLLSLVLMIVETTLRRDRWRTRTENVAKQFEASQALESKMTSLRQSAETTETRAESARDYVHRYFGFSRDVHDMPENPLSVPYSVRGQQDDFKTAVGYLSLPQGEHYLTFQARQLRDRVPSLPEQEFEGGELQTVRLHGGNYQLIMVCEENRNLRLEIQHNRDNDSQVVELDLPGFAPRSYGNSMTDRLNLDWPLQNHQQTVLYQRWGNPERESDEEDSEEAIGPALILIARVLVRSGDAPKPEPAGESPEDSASENVP